MHCPRGDGELLSHTIQGADGLTLSYSTCPTCSGYWLNTFAANYSNLPREKPPETLPPLDPTKPLMCPVCTSQLTRTTGESIPDNCLAFGCPNHHGYYFPAGELTKFKDAQKAKLTYFKLWNVPMSTARSVLLAGLLFLLLSGALVTTFLQVQKQQTLELKAQQVLEYQNVHKSGDGKNILVVAKTTIPTTVTLRIDTPDNITVVMTTSDNLSHSSLLTGIPAGMYRYWFTYAVEGKPVESARFILVIP